MKLTGEPAVDTTYPRPADAPVAETEELAPGIRLDLDASGDAIGIGISGLSWHRRAPTNFEIEPRPC